MPLDLEILSHILQTLSNTLIYKYRNFIGEYQTYFMILLLYLYLISFRAKHTLKFLLEDHLVNVMY